MKGRKKIGVIVTLALACGVFVAGGISHSTYKTVSAATIENLYVLEEYDLGKVFTIPQVQLKVDDKIVDSEYGYLLFPSGKASDKSPVVLDEEGVYTLVYTATLDGKKIKATKEFAVLKQVYKVGKENSSAYFGTHASLPSVEGLVVNLVNGDEFIYDEIIDLSDNTQKDEFIKFTTVTSKSGSADVREIVFRFTDIYDSENYFEIHVKNVVGLGDWALSQSYLCAGASGQAPGGWENAPGSRKFHTNNEYGFPVKLSMSSVPYDTATGYDMLTLCYDYSEKALYSDKEIYPYGNMVADFDDRDSFLNVWDGFTSGKVRMSVRGADYKTESMSVIIAQIDGKEPAKTISTDVAPTVNVDVDEGKAIPYALVGHDYKVFDASAFDTHDGYKDVAVHVYYNYGKEDQTVCNLINGKFTPKKTGVYSIVYTAVDDMGQRSQRVIEVEAFNHDGLSVEINGITEKGYTGKKSVLFDEIACQNASGDVAYTVTVNGEEILPQNGQYVFLPMADGTYNVTVTAKDYVKESSASFEFKSVRNYTPEIFDDINLPKYLIQGEEIQLPKVSGYDFSSGKSSQVDSQIFVRENGGEEKAIEGNSFIPSQTGEVEIIYRVAIAKRKAEKKVKAQVVSVFEGDDLRIDKFFKPISGDAVIGAENNYVSVTATKDSKVEFVNRVQVKSFNLNFVLSEEFNAVSKVNVYLTDCIDSSKQVKFTYSKAINGGATFSVNDGVGVEVDASFISSRTNFTLTYADGVAYGSSIVYATVDKYLNGIDFEGFSLDMAYLTIELEGVKGNTVLCLKNLNRQTLNNANKDRFAPQVLVSSMVGDRKLNEEIVLKEAFASDVLSNSCTFSLTVKTPNGDFAVAKDGTVLDGKTNDPTKQYELVLSNYGEYYIVYTAVDRFGKESKISYFVTVKDSVAPELSIGKAVNSAKVGDTVTVAEATATDNYSASVEMFVCVENPEGVYVEVTDGTFVAKMAGEYTVRYMVWDEAGNYTFKSYVVTVR